MKGMGQGNDRGTQYRSGIYCYTEDQKTLANAGLDYNKYAVEYSEKGGLSPESYTELQSKGMSTEMVDSWIQGQEAISEKFAETAYNSVGGEKNYEELVTWARETLPQNEIDSFILKKRNGLKIKFSFKKKLNNYLKKNLSMERFLNFLAKT